MAIRAIVYKTIREEIRLLSGNADIDKIGFGDIISFTTIGEDYNVERYVIGAPFIIDNTRISNKTSRWICQWNLDNALKILYTYGSLAISDEASYYIDTYTNSLIEKDDNVHVIANQMQLIKLLEEFIVEMTKGNVKKRTIR